MDICPWCTSGCQDVALVLLSHIGPQRNTQRSSSQQKKWFKFMVGAVPSREAHSPVVLLPAPSFSQPRTSALGPALPLEAAWKSLRQVFEGSAAQGGEVFWSIFPSSKFSGGARGLKDLGGVSAWLSPPVGGHRAEAPSLLSPHPKISTEGYITGNV